MVVPMSAPRITLTDWASVMSPELAKPTSITVVALDDWTTAVMKAPASIPLMRLLVIPLRMCRIRPPAACWSPSPTSCIP